MRVFNWFIPLDELRGRQETFNWLDDFEHTDVCVGESCENYDERLSELLCELGSVNKRRREIIEILMKDKINKH